MSGSLRIFNWLVFFMALGGLLAACSPSTARLIAVAVKTPAARFPRTGEYAKVASYLQMEVDQVDSASERAAWLAAVYGGYHSWPQSWYEGTQKITRLELYVTEENRDHLLDDLHTLGVIQSEDIWREVDVSMPSNCRNCMTYAHITLELRQKMGNPSLRPSSVSWHPGYTFERAFSVFMAIFSFIMNALIWIIVVIGPFVLLGLATWYLVRRLRK